MIAWTLVIVGLLRAVAFAADEYASLPVDALGWLAAGPWGLAAVQALAIFTSGIVMGLLVQIAKGVKFD